MKNIPYFLPVVYIRLLGLNGLIPRYIYQNHQDTRSPHRSHLRRWMFRLPTLWNLASTLLLEVYLHVYGSPTWHDTICYIRCVHSFFSHVDGLVQERRNSNALTMELRLFALNHWCYLCSLVTQCIYPYYFGLLNWCWNNYSLIY